MTLTKFTTLCCFVLAAVAARAEAPAQPAPESSLSFPDLTKQVRPSLVTIRSRGRDGRQDRMGTGFAVAPDGLIVTNLHVIGEGSPFTVETTDGRQLQVLAVEASDYSQDLALIRIAKDDDHPLPLLRVRESPIVQGSPVMAMGNPLGLEHSVVNGLVSAIREVDGREVIQLAMPIEPGNSGSPVVDQLGRVVGVVNMKSAFEKNVAFAVQAAALRRLIESPNPVSAEDWFHLGSLDPEQWTPLFGASWTQRSGKIRVKGSGRGFGGRSLCLQPSRDLPYPREIAVSVKLDDERGAAGLVFHADGKHRHYGFYPSNGRLRLTCFRGPTVYSWQVLREEASPAYRPGEWNELKVRLDDNGITCWVNGEKLFHSDDTSFQDGRIGLAKFRDTVAEFKRFRVGEQLDRVGHTAEALERTTTVVRELTDLPDVSPAQLDLLLENAAASYHVLNEKARDLEARAIRLQQQAREHRLLARDIHVRAAANQLAELSAADPDPDLLRAALWIARLEDEEVDVEVYVQAVEKMGKRIESSLPDDADDDDRLEALREFLFAQQGYHGSRFDYQQPANSFLNRVIDDREGLPITLSVLFMEVGARLGLKLEGVGLPGHFIVRYVPQAGDPILIDPFERGQEMTKAAAMARVRGQGLGWDDSYLDASSDRQILLRMVRNLYGNAERAQDREAMLRYLEAMVALAPESVQYRGLRAVMRRATGRTDLAVADLDWILAEQPEGIDLEEIRRMRATFRRP